MDMKRKLELLEAWENRHPEMGVISIRCSATDETFLATATDIPAKFNRIRFQLSGGNCPSKNLFSIYPTVPPSDRIEGDKGAKTGEEKLSKRHQPETI